MLSIEAQSRATYETWHEDVYADDAVADRPWHGLVRRYLRPSDIGGRTCWRSGAVGESWRPPALAMTPPPRRLVAADFARPRWPRRGASAARVDSRASWMVADVQAVGLPVGAFDTVISCETIEHLTDPVGALREFARILRPGGRLVFTTPNYIGRLRAVSRVSAAAGPALHRGRAADLPADVAAAHWWWLRRAGFRVRAVDACGHYALYPGRQPWEPAWLASLGRWLWPFGLHSVFVAEKPAEAR